MTKKWVFLFKEVADAEKYVGGDWERVRGLLGGKGANHWHACPSRIHSND